MSSHENDGNATRSLRKRRKTENNIQTNIHTGVPEAAAGAFSNSFFSEPESPLLSAPNTLLAAPGINNGSPMKIFLALKPPSTTIRTKIKEEYLSDANSKSTAIDDIETSGSENEDCFNSSVIKNKLRSDEYRLSDSPCGRSRVWKVFAKLERKNGSVLNRFVACRICKSVFKYEGSTSNMVRHKCYKDFKQNMFMDNAQEILGLSNTQTNSSPCGSVFANCLSLPIATQDTETSEFMDDAEFAEMSNAKSKSIVKNTESAPTFSEVLEHSHIPIKTEVNEENLPVAAQDTETTEFLDDAEFAEMSDVKSKSIVNNDTELSSSESEDGFDNAAIKAKLCSGEYKFCEKRGRSRVWEVFGKLERPNGSIVGHVVACRVCSNVFKFETSTSNLVKHKCYMAFKLSTDNVPEALADAESKKEINLAVTEWSLENCRPFNIVEDTGFKKIATALVKIGWRYGPNVKMEDLLPHSTTTASNVNDLYQIHVEKIRKELLVVKNHGYNISSELWTDNYSKCSYISLTVHFVKDSEMINRLLAITSVKEDLCTGAVIKKKIINALHKFNCNLSNEDTIFVTDYDPSLIAAFKEEKHLYCINHLLNNMVENAFRDIDELKEILDNARKLMKVIIKTATNSNFEKTLKSFGSTRWNKIYYLLKSIEINWPEISNIIFDKNEIIQINDININDITSLVNILAHFEKCSKTFEADTGPTLHLVIPHIHRLKKLCSINDSDKGIELKFKSTMKTLLESTVHEHITVYHRIALFLFPPTNKLLQCSNIEREETIEHCKNLMHKFDCGQLEEVKVEVKTENYSGDDLFSDFVDSTTSETFEDRIKKEILGYLNVQIPYRDEFNVLNWWSSNKLHFPFLYKLSCKILGTPASSTLSERVFSHARSLLTEEIVGLACHHIDMVNKIMVLNNNLKK